MIYLLTLLAILVGIYRFDNKHLLKSLSSYKKYAYFVYLLLALVPGLSYRIGVDIPSYMLVYDSIPSLDNLTGIDIENSSYEPGWVVFCSFFKIFSDNFALMHMVHALLFNGIVIWFLYNHTDRVFSAILFYFLTMWVHINFEALREALAIILFLVALNHFLKHGNYLVYFLISIPTILFHKFAFVMAISIPLFLLLSKGKKYVSIPLVLATAVLLIIYREDIMAYVWMSSMLDNEELIEEYLASSHMNIFGIISSFITKVLPPLLVILAMRNGQSATDSKKTYISLLWLQTFLGIVACFIPLFTRFWFYLVPITASCIGIILNTKVTLKPAVIAMLLILYVSNINSYVKPSYMEHRPNVHYNAFYFPYHSVLTMKEDPIREGLPRR